MRIIFSRKGFDTQYGQVSSPIFPDGTVCSLPIPYPNSGISYDEIQAGEQTMGALIRDLRGGKSPLTQGAHLDPDLVQSARPRAAGWRPTFGQIGAAQAHLANQGVGSGDIFLFFGLFRHVHQVAGRWCYRPDCRPVHLIFGWLQVGNRHAVNLALARQYPWLSDHPHIADHWQDANNTVYVAADTLTLRGREMGSGAGVIPSAKPQHVLTMPGRSPSNWLLPGWLMPTERVPPLSYHGDASRWLRAEEGTVLSAVAKGQEFVLPIDSYPEATAWLQELLA